MSVTAQEALAFGAQQLETPTPENGIVVIYNSHCGHCQRSLENTNMATQTSNGTPVKWIDIATPEGLAAFTSLPGVTAVNGAYTVNGQAITSVPTTLGMQNGNANEVLKVGVLARNDLNMFAAMQQSRGETQGTGNSIPYNAAPKPVGQVQGR